MVYSILYVIYIRYDLPYNTFVIYDYTQHHILYTMISLARPTKKIIGSHFWSCGQLAAFHKCE